MNSKRECTLTGCQEARYVVWLEGHPPLCDQPYWRWCEKERIPYVRITTRGDEADVLMVCTWLPLKLDEHARTQLKDLLHRIHLPVSRKLFATSNIYVEGLCVRDMEKVAAEIYTIGWDFGRRSEELIAQNLPVADPSKSPRSHPRKTL